MQKLINLMAVSSFVVSGLVLASVGYVFVNKDSIIDGVKDKVAAEIAEIIPSLIGGAALGTDLAPSVPDVPGDAPMPSVPGLPF